MVYPLTLNNNLLTHFAECGCFYNLEPPSVVILSPLNLRWILFLIFSIVIPLIEAYGLTSPDI